MSQGSGSRRDRRRHRRVALQGEVQGKIHTMAAAPVVNLSVSGALLEVPAVLKPRASYTLRLSFAPGQYMDLPARVVRSYVHGFDLNVKGENVIKYRAAIEFVSIGEDQKAALLKVIEQLANRQDGAALRAQLT